LHILAANVLCSIATVTPEGHAHVNTAYFCYSDELELFFLSHPTAIHCQNLSRNRSMAVTVFSSSQQWLSPDKGIQLFGTCSEATGPDATQEEKLYRQRFSAYANWKASLQDQDSTLEYCFYRFVVSKLKVLDEANFGVAVFASADVHRKNQWDLNPENAYPMWLFADSLWSLQSLQVVLEPGRLDTKWTLRGAEEFVSLPASPMISIPQKSCIPPILDTG
jgi:uncharacterized protein YhbP (UPF0306 family)